ncbi:MAG: Eco57I restriction-modification methylase domain-containing protein, partial [Thermodesulfobacteriota bacterium]
EFVDPFFEALGWDMNNKQGYAEAYKDIIHEDAIKFGGATKAPDYCFRIGGTRKFFVEAKKPSVNLKEDTSPAFQLRRYAWSAKLPISILTDFEEFVVYDCRIKPIKTDKASAARVFYLDYTEYAKRWDEIASIFSRDSLLKGSFDKYAESSKLKKGTAEVDDAFLKEIEFWRETLAHNLALRNPTLTQRELNFAVQMIIDRMIFLRICEDRGIEDYGRLMALQNGTQVYKRLCELFIRADERYNSGLFHFRHEKGRPELPDDLTLNLSIDDKLLKEIIRNLYYPDSPYEFSVLPADILGHVYEQFLGKVIRLTPGHRAIVEDKPEVKKAGGVYYTPTYIVEYIVKNTVGKLLEGKSPKQVAKLKILDPACGSGSFLINAYQYLLNWHRDWYVKDGPKEWATRRSPVLYQGHGGNWRLTTSERKRILLNNIYGVDIDSQAVEVTKLSLLLKVLEGENEETLSRQLKLFHQRALPDLGSNIKCGNSLIGPDFYKNQQMSFLNEEERYRINVFDWQAEFPEIMKSGGFNAVIGNPPYVRQEMLVEFKEYFQPHYKVYHGVADLYVYFIERSFSLLKSGGQFGMIVASKWMKSNYGEP